ncbi:MAG TPA: phosphotransferase [Candidatus Angelobacter sp.]|nr:phosphotransferase [Candidatus Angelobacter sp.]
MLVKGNSGFGIELVNELTIRKSSSPKEAERLKRQIEKQIQFCNQSHHDRVRTPRILTTATANGVFHADMEFVAAKDFVQFLSEADRGALDDFAEVLVRFIVENLKASKEAEVSGDIRAKLKELAGRGVPAKYILMAERRCQEPISVPVGSCHGDLTLSNILFKGDTLYLLDFLDSYVESPLQDIVKIRQDTYFFWSLLLYQADFNWPRVQISLHYLDGRIEGAFQSYDWYRRHYELFQFVNMMRVLPYCVEAKTTKLVADALEAMSKHFTAESR